MVIFQPAVNTSAFLKMGIMGKQGAGKTKTAGKVAIGLVRYCKEKGAAYADKPVAFFDTETGSDYLIPDFEEAGIPFMVAKTKTLADLVEGMDWAEKNASALIIDSITHPYREMIAAYLKAKKRTFLQIDDWTYLKGDYGWAMFTRRYINSKLHVIMCGRAGDDLQQYVDEDGKRQLEKVGTKMKTETETGFEPSLLVLMELVERNAREQGARLRTFINRATIVKDRWDKINGDQIDDPDFKDFLPHVALLNIGGEHVGVRDTGDSQRILKTEKRDWQPVQRRIVINEIQDLLVLHVPGQAAAEKQRKVALLKKHFKGPSGEGASWTEIEEALFLDDLRLGYDTLHRELEERPSKYAQQFAPEKTTTDINDSLPDHSAPPTAAAATEPAADPVKPLADTKADEGIPRECVRDPAVLEAKLIGDIPNLDTIVDCGRWLGEAISKYGADLGPEAVMRVSNALLARQSAITAGLEKARKAGKAAAEKAAAAKTPATEAAE